MVATGFNTQPPEGGWTAKSCSSSTIGKFQHTAARRRLVLLLLKNNTPFMFQHTAARRRLEGRSIFEPSDLMFQHTAARRRLVDVALQQRHHF